MCTAQVIVEINQKWHNKCKYLIPTFFFFFPQWLQPNMNEKLLNFFASECSNNRNAWKSVGAKSDAHEGTPQYNNFPLLLRFILHCVMLENNTFSVRHYWYNASFAWWLAINVRTGGPSLFHQFVIDNILFFYIPPEIKTFVGGILVLVLILVSYLVITILFYLHYFLVICKTHFFINCNSAREKMKGYHSLLE